MIKNLLLFLLCFVVQPSFTQTFDSTENSSDFQITEQTLSEHNAGQPANCANEIFVNSLLQNSDEISENAPGNEMRIWAQQTIQNADTLQQILKCPEIQRISDDTTIYFTPIVYKFENGRNITINYSTQPKVLKQKIMLANKRSLPYGNTSPDLMNISDRIANNINTTTQKESSNTDEITTE